MQLLSCTETHTVLASATLQLSSVWPRLLLLYIAIAQDCNTFCTWSVQANTHVSIHTHTHVECSHASVGLAQARSKNILNFLSLQHGGWSETLARKEATLYVPGGTIPGITGAMPGMTMGGAMPGMTVGYMSPIWSVLGLFCCGDIKSRSSSPDFPEWDKMW